MNVNQPRLPYFKLQEIRQTNIRDALLDETTPPTRLVELFEVAHKGLKLAVLRGAVESDAITFLNLEDDIRSRLEETLPLEQAT